jgi:hypothetical protein
MKPINIFYILLFVIIMGLLNSCTMPFDSPAIITKIEYVNNTSIKQRYKIYFNNSDVVVYYTDSLYKVGDIIK